MDNNFENSLNSDDTLSPLSSEQQSIENSSSTNIPEHQDFDSQSEELDELSSLKLKLKEQESYSKDLLDKFQRTLAEFDNFRKRSSIEKSNMFDNGASYSIEKLLPILDNFERAIDASSEDEKQSSIFKGLSMIHSQMLEAFTSLGLSEIQGVGSTFDPNFHNAVLHIEDSQLEQNIIVEVLQKGYTFKDKVLRPSMVKVAN